MAHQKLIYPPLWWYFFALGGITTLLFVGFVVPFWVDLPYEIYIKGLGVLVILIHISEAIYAYLLASHPALLSVRWQWTMQTLFLGIYALFLLKKVLKQVV